MDFAKRKEILCSSKTDGKGGVKKESGGFANAVCSSGGFANAVCSTFHFSLRKILKYISNFPSLKVEVLGIEPRSSSTKKGLLRA